MPEEQKAFVRMSWEEYFINIAQLAAQRSTCLRRQVGAVAVRDNRVLATGYNGVPSGIKHCKDRGCYRALNNIPSGTQHKDCWGVHAEQNLLVQASIHGISLSQSTVYCTNQPCFICMKMLANLKCDHIYYENPYPDKLSVELLHEAYECNPVIEIAPNRQLVHWSRR